MSVRAPLINHGSGLKEGRIMNNSGRGSHPVHTRGGRARLAAGLLLACTAGAAAQTVTFVRSDYGSVSGARAMVSADFNRDGAPDLAQANNGRNTVMILLNDHGGGFVRGVEVAVGAGPFAMATADLNRDGIPDLAVANADGNSISVLRGNGDGSFTRVDIAAPGNPRGLAVGDVNNDGKEDLVYSAWATGAVQVLIGDGAGRFTKGITYLSAAQNPQGLATADFNHDGHLDVAVAYATATGLRILYGNGGTAFSARTVSGEANVNVVATGDFDADGWTDVAAASTPNSAVTVYRGTATGLIRVQRYSVGSSPRGIVVSDVDDDGLLDIATANRASNTISVLRNDPVRPGSFLPASEYAADTGSRAIAAADFDGDGLADLATANEVRQPHDRPHQHHAARPRCLRVPRNVARKRQRVCCVLPDVLWTADFNRDGKVDIATSTTPVTGFCWCSRMAPLRFAGRRRRPCPASGGLRCGRNRRCPVRLDRRPSAIGVFLGDGRGHFTPSGTSSIRSRSAFHPSRSAT